MNLRRFLSGDPQSIEDEIRRLEASTEALLARQCNELLTNIEETNAQRPGDEQQAVCSNIDVAEIALELDGLESFVSERLPVKRSRLEAKEAFKQMHGLTHDPKPGNAVAGLLAAGCTVGVEGIINTAFLEGAHLTATPLSASMVAGTLSLTTVSISTIAGYAIGRRLDFGLGTPEPNHPDFAKERKTAQLGMGAYIVTMGAILLSGGLIRSQETLTQVHHSLRAYGELLSTPEALWLMGIGAACSWLAFANGKRAFADPYFGFSDYQQEIDEVQDELEDACENCKEAIDSALDKARVDNERDLKKTRRVFDAYNTAVRKCHSLYNDLTSAVRIAEKQLAFKREQLSAAQPVTRGRPKANKAATSPSSFSHLLTLKLSQESPLPSAAQFNAEFSKARTEAYARLSALQQQINHNPNNLED